MKRSNITLAQYVAQNAPDEAMEFLAKSGISRKPRNFEDIGNCVQEVLNKKKEAALYELLKIHPDREAILAASKSKLNADGQWQFEAGEETTKDQNGLTPEHITNAIFIGSLALIAGAVFITILKT